MKLYHVLAIRPLQPGDRKRRSWGYSVPAESPAEAEAIVRADDERAEHVICMFAFEGGFSKDSCNFLDKDDVARCVAARITA